MGSKVKKQAVFLLGENSAGDLMGEFVSYDPSTGDLVMRSPMTVTYTSSGAIIHNNVLPMDFPADLHGDVVLTINRNRYLYHVLFDMEDEKQPSVKRYLSAVRDALVLPEQAEVPSELEDGDVESEERDV